jgi:hypothetical protein
MIVTRFFACGAAVGAAGAGGASLFCQSPKYFFANSSALRG